MQVPAFALTLLHPRHWPVWLGFGILRLCALLPYSAGMALGRGLGRLFMRVARSRRRIAEINLALCFPELSDAERATLARQHFESLGMALVEISFIWWWPGERFNEYVQIEGEEHIPQALAQGRGIIFVSAHFTTLEVHGRILGGLTPVSPMYREFDNPVVAFMVLRNRSRAIRDLIPKNDARKFIRTLKANESAWIIPDQDSSMKYSVFADFFGVPAATNVSISRFARITGAAVIPFTTERLDQGYRTRFLPALEAFPSDDVVDDARRLNRLFETWIRAQPAQYLWIHRRFKHRPPGEASPY